MGLFDKASSQSDNADESETRSIGENDQILAPEAITRALEAGERPEPHRIEEVERDGSDRIPIGMSLKLTYNDLTGQLDGYHGCWVTAEKLEAYLMAGYQPVFKHSGVVGQDKHEPTDMSSWESRQSGNTRLYLLKLKDELHKQDVAKLNAESEEVERALQGGMLDEAPNQLDPTKRGLTPDYQKLS
jgi:hypothetical protein